MTPSGSARTAAWLCAGLAACASSGSVGAGPPATSAAPGAASPSPTTAPSTPGASTTPTASAAPSTGPRGPLSPLHDALRGLERGTLGRHARIVWLGDSHAQADFWTGGLRRALQRRFGNAGPGFVHLGMARYRHDAVELALDGSWRMRPRMPSTTERMGDGRYGLGGILHGAYGGARTATMTLRDDELRDKRIRWDLCVKASSAKDRLTLEVGDASEVVDGARAPAGTLVHLERETPGAHRIRVRMNAGSADLCGVYVATDPAERPGVLVDNLGINGARYATALAWDEQSWAAELRRRPTDLVVLEYGGNEASDPTPRPEAYRRDAEALIAWVRRAAPEAGCIVVGPADRADKEATIPLVVKATRDAAAASGCAFWDTWAKMGGKGSLARWREEKKAAPDGIHLFPKGYAEVAALFTEDLLAGYVRE
ncbi:MAG: hypothetical protein FJ095_19460 [Deltaproteobacteria bacterium]|nr:hypothetical protein [Deltaproteobacteria bacterium]